MKNLVYWQILLIKVVRFRKQKKRDRWYDSLEILPVLAFLSSFLIRFGHSREGDLVVFQPTSNGAIVNRVKLSESKLACLCQYFAF